MGLNRHPQLLQMYIWNYTTLVYQAQAQAQDPLLEEKAKDCAQRVKLIYEYRITAFENLAVAIDAMVEQT